MKDSDAYNDFSFEVLNYAAALRDVADDEGGFAAVLACTAIQSAGRRVERNFGVWLVEELRSKKSTAFAAMGTRVENPTKG